MYKHHHHHCLTPSSLPHPATLLLPQLSHFHQAPTGPRKDKPIRLHIPHPLFTTDGAEVCLFVKDHKGEGHKAAKARLAKLQKHGGIAKVVGLSKLRTKYESHEAKRQLCSAYDLFLADERIIPSLPKLIGEGCLVLGLANNVGVRGSRVCSECDGCDGCESNGCGSV